MCDSMCAFCSPVYGLIFLFKWRSEQDDRTAVTESEYLGKVFFARQVITNACATQAILSVLLNRPDIQLGLELTNLKDFTAEFPPDIKGDVLTHAVQCTMHIFNIYTSSI